MEGAALVDSSAFLALLDRSDEHYQAAAALLQRLAKNKYRLFTSNFIVAESHALVLSVLGRQIAASFLRALEGGSTIIVRATEDDEQQARNIVYQYDDKDFSFADALSFAIIERLRIPYAFAFDKHFSQYGVPLLK